MELQRINSLSLSGMKDSAAVDFADGDDYQASMDKIIDRLMQKGAQSKPERGHITATSFDVGLLTVFFGMSTGRVGMFVRDPSKYGNIADVVCSHPVRR